MLSACPDCGASTVGALSFCRQCDQYLPDQALGLRAASLWVRLGANLLDSLIMLITLFVGWFIWLIFTAKDGQTPGKKLVGIRCVALNGSSVSAGTMWVREVVIKMILWGLVLGTFLLGWLPYLWAFWDKDKQALHDKMVNTLVVKDPEGSRRHVAQGSANVQEELQRLASLREEGLITTDEFEEKRKRLVADL